MDPELRQAFADLEQRLMTRMVTEIQASEGRMRDHTATVVQAAEGRMRDHTATVVQAAEGRMRDHTASVVQAAEERLVDHAARVIETSEVRMVDMIRSSVESSQRQIMVVVEGLRSDFRMATEGFAPLHRRTGGLEEEVERTRQRVDQHDARLAALEQQRRSRRRPSS